MALTTQEIPFSGRNKFNMKYFFIMAQQPYWAKASCLSRIHCHTTIDRTTLDEWSARRRGLYLTIHNTHKKQTSMPLTGFELTIPASERPQTHASDRAAAGIG